MISEAAHIMIEDVASAGGMISLIEGEAEKYYGCAAVAEAEQLGLIRYSVSVVWGDHETIALTNKGRSYMGLPETSFLLSLRENLSQLNKIRRK